MEKLELKNSICKHCGHDVAMDGTPFQFDEDGGVKACANCEAVAARPPGKASPILNNSEMTNTLLVGIVIGAVIDTLLRLWP